jgi:hypothetical protein
VNQAPWAGIGKRCAGTGKLCYSGVTVVLQSIDVDVAAVCEERKSMLKNVCVSVCVNEHATQQSSVVPT